MIILNKKRLLYLNFSIILSIFYASFIFQNLKTESVSSTPISNHTIILDAGHGFPDGGATGENGSIESTINLDIVLKLQNLLEISGCNVILTRSDENGIYEETADSIREKKISDMKKRVNIANTSNSELFISIHQNKINEKIYSGWQTFYKNKDDESIKLAQNIQSNLNTYISNENKREIKSLSGIYLTKNVNIPLVLIECGFLSNPNENKLLQDSNYQEKIAWSIYIGIMDYFEKEDEK